ncbi:hypothetical protein L8P40_20930 [Enterobacter kobei]|uniref:hypothetical protein n=1 Tax=Enterobacter kobei TaxID=208224 RepID=UPI0020058CB4|nr:hypothetical protein [Enterobacter kobei]MCK7157775.1 hypothetical protein [Enterobacter kobei]MCK7243524.1 hypothetical protein [Enterobacter kobei]MCK7359514.1 hypothetical protein [Enterobacter roggenkampii]
MSAPTEPVDFSGPAPQDPAPATPLAEETPPARKPTSEYLEQEERNDKERRTMRYWLFGVMMLFAVIFLGCGLNFALNVGNGLLSAKKDIVAALTQPDVSHCVIPVKCVPGPPRGVSEAVANLNADWLSASSMIMIAAFILGVGLTLILTLLKSAFRHPTDRTFKDETNQTSLELATPLSELISGIASYLKDKFSK